MLLHVYLGKYSWTLDAPDGSFIFPTVYDRCVSTGSGEEIKLQTAVIHSELEEFDFYSYLLFLCLLIFYRLVPIKLNCWELAGDSGYRQGFYMLFKMNKNLEHLQVLNVCGMQATDHSVAKGFGAECCCDLIYMWLFKLK